MSTYTWEAYTRVDHHLALDDDLGRHGKKVMHWNTAYVLRVFAVNHLALVYGV
jgi:hypothetical protein